MNILLPLAFCLAFLSSSLCSLLDTTSSSYGHLSTRAVSAYICATISIDVPLPQRICTTVPITGITTCVSTGLTLELDVAENVCLCLTGGALTPDSIASLTAVVNANGTVVQTLTGLVNGTTGYTGATLLTYIENEAIQLLGSQSTSCTYPTGSDPNSCTSCAYTCPANTYLCGNACVSTSKTCVSGVAQRRRDLRNIDVDFRCPRGYTGCALANTRLFDGNNFECVDTTSDIESCGGCAYPLPGRKVGEDCTAIPHTNGVGCVSGQCVIHGCVKGYQLDGTGKACRPVGDASNDAVITDEETNLEMVFKQPVSSQASREKKSALKRYQVNTERLRSVSPAQNVNARRWTRSRG